MGIFSNFVKNRSSILNVLQALDNFKADLPSFEAVKKHSIAFFGENWKFNLEMYIASLPQNDRAKYYEIFKMVVEYEQATNYWNRAVKITNYTIGVSRDDLIEAGLYKKHLSKFGVEGIRLYQKLEKFLHINETSNVGKPEINEIVADIPSDYATRLKNIIKQQVEKVSDSVNTIKKGVEAKKSVNKKDTNFVATLNEVIDEEPVIQKKSKTENIATLNEVINEGPVIQKKVKKENIATLDEVINEPKVVANVKEKKVIKPSQPKSKDWDVASFYQIHEFMPTIRNIMAVISIYKKSSIEEYNGYVFLNDVIDYLINEGEKILLKTTDEDMKKKLIKVINQYKEEKLNEVEYKPKTNTETKDKPYKNPYEN